jgi:hypothetical protein
MGFLDSLSNLFKPKPSQNPASVTSYNVTTSPQITSDDLHIYDGPSRSLNIDKLEWCINQGLDNEAIRDAKREKEMIDKMDCARSSSNDQLEDLYQQTSAESKQYNIKRSDDPETKAIKKAQKEKLWNDYHKKKAAIESRKNSALSSAYGDRFFADLKADEDAVGWEWCLSSSDTHCETCKKNVGKYKKGKGPKFPAHDGCTCNFSIVYKGEL